MKYLCRIWGRLGGGLFVHNFPQRHREMDLKRIIQQDEVRILADFEAALAGGDANGTGGVQAGCDPELL